MAHAQFRSKGFTSEVILDKNNLKFVSGLLFFLVLITTMILMSIWFYKWMGDEKSQPIAEIIITGERRFTTDDDIRHLLLALGNLTTVMNQDINVLRAQIETIPWLKEVRLKKRWPNRLIIDVKEYTPVVRWNKNLLLDNQANVFNIPTERTLKLPLALLSGPDGKEKEALAGFLQLQDVFVKNNMVLFSAHMTARYSWVLTVVIPTRGQNQLVEVDIGRNDFLGRANKFVSIFREFEKDPSVSANVKRIDLRYESGVAVTWHNVIEEMKTP